MKRNANEKGEIKIYQIYLCLIFSAFCLMSSCVNRKEGVSEARAIFGADDRKPTDDQAFTETVGVLYGPKSNCTAFVYDKQVIVTAHHCLTSSDKNLNEYEFKTKQSRSKILDIAWKSENQDLVLLKTEALFDKIPKRGLPDKNRKIEVVGINNGNLVKSDTCDWQYTDPTKAALSYQCDTSPGMSGSAIVQNDVIVGMHIGYANLREKNIGIIISDLMNSATNLSDFFYKPEFDDGDAFVTVELTWSSAGGVTGYCTNFNEEAEPPETTWRDNFLCSNLNLGLEFNQNQPVARKKCIDLAEPADEHTWIDNHLCWRNHTFNMEFFHAPSPRMNDFYRCIRIHEDADVAGTWHDNYICYDRMQVPIAR